MHKLFCKHLYFPLRDRYKGIPFQAKFEIFERNQYLSEESLRNQQFEQLTRLVSHAAMHCTFYKQLYEEAGVVVSDLENPSDIQELPMVTKSDVAANNRDMIAAKHPGRLMRGLTSGSTGESLEYYYDSHHYAAARACLWRARRWWGIERCDPELILWSRPVEQELSTEWQTVIKNRLRNNYQFNTFQQLKPKYLSKILRTIHEKKPRLIYGYASSLVRLAQYATEHAPSSHSPYDYLRLVEYTADHMSPAENKLVEDAFDTPVVSQYGASETPSITNECPNGNSHLAIDQVYVEIVKEDGSPAARGEVGELVVTSLYNYGMPMIRYRVGDRGVFPEKECDCGVNLPLMELRAGRVADLITTSEREEVSSHVLDHINMYLMRKGYEGIRQFLIEQMKLDVFKLSVVRSDSFSSETVNEFKRQMRSYLGEQIEIDVEYVEQIPVSNTGKRRFFKSHLEVHND